MRLNLIKHEIWTFSRSKVRLKEKSEFFIGPVRSHVILKLMENFLKFLLEKKTHVYPRKDIEFFIG